LRLILAAVGRLKAGPERELFDRYAKRAAALAGPAGLTGVSFREIDEGKARDVDERRAAEGRALADIAGKGAFVCALDERGAAATSAGWAQEIARTRDSGQAVYAVVIGGPDGFDPEFRRAARAVVAFGGLTWPHQLVRVMAAEQIYRSLTILTGHPYHRA
jgi:23S rRNA (pseudouridine1915-N3)-methyltransferase